LIGAIDVSAHGSRVTAGARSSSVVILNGRSRISGDGFPAFEIENQLQIQSRAGFLLLTIKMPLEQYVAAVLQGESAGFKSDEALKAMAVSARTYAIHFGSRHRLEGFDFCDTTHCQDLRLGNESARAKAAVAATEGELLWFEGRPAATYYHRSCGGEIDGAGVLDPNLRAPYLRPHQDEFCLQNSDEWHSEINRADLSHALGLHVNSLNVVARSSSGRVQKLLIDDKSMGATEFRFTIDRALGWETLRSDFYQVQYLGGRILFRGRGQGHGVGLCQTGADNMGEQGHGYREILAYYYPGAALGLNAQGLMWEKLPGESLDVLTTNRDDAAVLLPAAERALQYAAQQTGWILDVRPQLKVYPTIAVYRDATGEPGWVAASTQGSFIRMEPVPTLEGTHALDSTLRYEFLHLLIESHARPGAPLWLREGLAIYLSSPRSVKPEKLDVSSLERRLQSQPSERQMRAAYRESAAAVADEVTREGLSNVLTSLRR
jgi:stage II sporulation protein D